MDGYEREQVQDALYVLNEMMDTFEQWYPLQEDYLPESSREHLTKEELDEAKEQFARTKLALELGSYDESDYDYLQWLQRNRCRDERYVEALGTIIYALSEEYGPI